MNKYERTAFWAFMALVAGVILYIILPPIGWAVVATVAASYGLCALADRALRRVWRRR